MVRRVPEGETRMFEALRLGLERVVVSVEVLGKRWGMRLRRPLSAAWMSL